MALEQMEGFELAGRTVSFWPCCPYTLLIFRAKLRVNTVHEKGTVKYTQQDSLDEAGGRLSFPSSNNSTQLLL